MSTASLPVTQLTHWWWTNECWCNSDWRYRNQYWKKIVTLWLLPLSFLLISFRKILLLTTTICYGVSFNPKKAKLDHLCSSWLVLEISDRPVDNDKNQDRSRQKWSEWFVKERQMLKSSFTFPCWLGKHCRASCCCRAACKAICLKAMLFFHLN